MYILFEILDQNALEDFNDITHNWKDQITKDVGIYFKELLGDHDILSTHNNLLRFVLFYCTDTEKNPKKHNKLHLYFQDYLQMKKYSNAFHDDLFSALDQVLEDLSHNFSVFDSGWVFRYVVRFVQSMMKPIFNPTCT